MMTYWETETPIRASTRKNELEYYREAGKLAISRPSWTDGSGESKRGKTVTLDLAALRESPEAARLLLMIAEDAGNPV